MIKNFLMVALLFVAVGCTKEQIKEEVKDAGNVIACAAQDSIVTVTTEVVAKELACTGKDAIKAFLNEQAAKTKVCKQEESVSTMGVQSVVGDLICEPMIETLVSTGLQQIPAAWACTGGENLQNAKAKILEVCKKSL